MSLDISIEVGHMAALAGAARSEFERGNVADNGFWLLDLLNVDLNHLKSRIDRGDYDDEIPQAELELVGGAK